MFEFIYQAAELIPVGELDLENKSNPFL